MIPAPSPHFSLRTAFAIAIPVARRQVIPVPRRRLTMSAAASQSKTVGIRRLNFVSSFTEQLPGDIRSDQETRQVFNAAYSKVSPTNPAVDDLSSVWKKAVEEGHVRVRQGGDPVIKRALIAWSPSCAKLFDLDDGYPADDEKESIVEVLGGFGSLWPGMKPYAMCYGGHQFGTWAGQLGDGRAISLGEFVNKNQERWEIQLKGAGKTPYSRFADGRAVLRSSIREFLCSEAMHHLGVPTTRALSLVGTGAGVVRDMFYTGDPQLEPGAVVARVAPSFLRLGNFQLATYRSDDELLQQTADYAIKNHFPHLMDLPTHTEDGSPGRYAAFVKEVARRNAEMVAKWQAVGFVHGVMNTDNLSILGLTIDYGPYGFLDDYDPNYTPNTTDLPGRRYKYEAQPSITKWNISQFAKSMVKLCGDGHVQEVLNDYESSYQASYNAIMANKLGLAKLSNEQDRILLADFLDNMKQSKADFTNAWRALSQISMESTPAECERWCAQLSLLSNDASSKAWTSWMTRYVARLRQDDGIRSQEQRVQTMNATNPVYILRNYLVQIAIDKAEKGDFSEVQLLYTLLMKPYEEQEGMERFTNKPPEWASRPGVCVNSCSS
ncbi:hypothetical protein BWQ96_02037 [Gracilariopsis chorda]|uniref:Selenoprotein O n=1 Tax=Gracilariopsis chorda TaxID=448386 RepID=A0A2V3J189_9FLOR|nr:hypothetical protein BWQ96_02037 [Gracilariopsis chorda]|eukprot:PXF48085.1 hypothetical protein BWQ96_02037 [Gracilariopsis chorda]